MLSRKFTINPGDDRTGAATDVTIRPLTSETDLEACMRLQRETWGADFRELVPPALLKIAQLVGGIAAGAFEPEGHLVGFVFGLTGVRDGRLVHWSHMLAVTEHLRSRGIGRLLKQYQRAQLRDIGVERMFWTFDPLVARNAHLNLNRLGARVVEYVEDMYGHNPASTMDSVIGSDRFVVEWNLTTPSGDRASHAVLQTDVPVVTLDPAQGAAPEAFPTTDAVRIEVPEDIQTLKVSQPSDARAWRAFTRRALLYYLGHGYIVGGLARDPSSGRAFYVLSRAAPR